MSELIDPAHASRDLKLVEKAIREDWNIPESIKENAALVAWKISIDPKSSARDKVAALKVLVAMKASNDRLKVQRHQHVHAIIPAPHESELDAIKREGFERLARLRNHG